MKSFYYYHRARQGQMQGIHSQRVIRRATDIVQRAKLALERPTSLGGVSVRPTPQYNYYGYCLTRRLWTDEAIHFIKSNHTIIRTLHAYTPCVNLNVDLI